MSRRRKRSRYSESYSSKKYETGNPPFGYKWRIRGPVSQVKTITLDDLPKDSTLRNEVLLD